MLVVKVQALNDSYFYYKGVINYLKCCTQKKKKLFEMFAYNWVKVCVSYFADAKSIYKKIFD